MKKYVYKFKNQPTTINATFKQPIIFEKGLNTQTQKLLMTIVRLEKALDMLLDMSVDKESGICCTYGCPNKDEDIESGCCVGKCMTKEELKEYLFKESGEK